MKTTQQKLTILLEQDVYNALKRRAGRGNMGRFISEIIRPHVLGNEVLEQGYAEMASDKKREQEAQDWIEGLLHT